MATVTADILPECLIQKILSYCSFKRAAKMSILSKTWLQAWLTLPNLKFRARYYKDAEIMDAILERYRDNNNPIDKFEFLNCLTSSREVFFPLIDKWLDIALQNGVRDMVYGDPTRLSPSYPFHVLKILAAKSLRELVLQGCDLMLQGSLSSDVANCYVLRKLSLSYVRLDGKMLQTLINSCPLIDTFILEYCLGLEKIELLNLQKVKSVSIKTSGNLRVKIQAPTLEHMLCSGCSLEEDNVESQNLKSLVLSNVLKIQCCSGIEEIDAPNLVSLDYEGAVPEFKIAKELSQLKHSKIHLYNFNELNAAWFCKLRKFLVNATSWTHVDLWFNECDEIEMKGLQLHHKVAISQVDILDVYIRSSRKCPTVVDALLWSCRPRRLNLQSTSEIITCFMDCLMYMKNPSRQSTSHGSKLWHCQLKEVKAYKFNSKSQPVELRSGELASLTGWESVYFLLDW